MFLLIWFIWGVSQTSYYSAGEERANFLKIFWNVRMSAKSQGICWGLTAVLTVFSDMICFRGISLLETQGIVPESGSSLGQEELALLSPLSRLNKFAQMYKGSSVWQKKNASGAHAYIGSRLKNECKRNVSLKSKLWKSVMFLRGIKANR